MFTSFIVALNAVLPFVLYMSIGATVVKVGLVDRPFLRKLNGFCFKAFFPFMTFMNIYDMEGDIGLSGRFLMYACGSMAVIFILSVLAVLHFEKDDKKRPCLMQAFYRSNILLFAIPLARTLLGDNAVGLATALVLIFVPFYNVSSVILLETFCGSGRSKPSKLIKEILLSTDFSDTDRLRDLLNEIKLQTQMMIQSGGHVAAGTRANAYFASDAACRDLTSGIQDVFPLPVIGVLNQRPNGPCFNTCVDMRQVEAEIRSFIQEEDTHE